MEVIEVLVSSILTGLVTGAAAWGAIRIELKYHRRDIDHAHRRIDDMTGEHSHRRA